MNKRINLTTRICLCAILTAIAFLATSFLPTIPLPNGAGYLNIGDSIILLSAIYIDPFCGVIVGIVSGGLADFVAGYSFYIPFTIIAKGSEALLAGYIFKIKKPPILRYIGVYLGAFAMATVYIVPDLILLRNFAPVMFNYGLNILQGLVGASISLVLFFTLKRSYKK